MFKKHTQTIYYFHCVSTVAACPCVNLSGKICPLTLTLSFIQSSFHSGNSTQSYIVNKQMESQNIVKQHCLPQTVNGKSLNILGFFFKKETVKLSKVIGDAMLCQASNMLQCLSMYFCQI